MPRMCSQFAAHQDMSPPVALLVYENDAPSSAVYYPFATFSPEWQALRWALDKDVPARFIDLPQSLRPRDRPAADGEDGEPAQEPGVRRPSRRRIHPRAAILSTRWRSPRGSRMERRGGAASSKNATPRTIRSGSSTRSAAPWRRRARSSAARRTIPRSPHAKRTCARASAPPLKEGFERIAVVCGAWHAPVLTADALKRSSGEAGRRDPQAAAETQDRGDLDPVDLRSSLPRLGLRRRRREPRVVRPSVGAPRPAVGALDDPGRAASPRRGHRRLPCQRDRVGPSGRLPGGDSRTPGRRARRARRGDVVRSLPRQPAARAPHPAEARRRTASWPGARRRSDGPAAAGPCGAPEIAAAEGVGRRDDPRSRSAKRKRHGPQPPAASPPHSRRRLGRAAGRSASAGQHVSRDLERFNGGRSSPSRSSRRRSGATPSRTRLPRPSHSAQRVQTSSAS